MNIKYISTKSLELCDAMYPQLAVICKHNVVNYLSWYLSYNGSKIYHHPHQLHSIDLLKSHFNHPRFQTVEDILIQRRINYEHIFAKNLLFSNFFNHVVDHQTTQNILQDFHQLHQIHKQDIIQQIIQAKCHFSKQKSYQLPFQIIGQQLPTKHKRNAYIVYPFQLPEIDALENIIVQNQFNLLPNFNKILVFANPSQDVKKHIIFKQELELYCKKHSIRIKLIENKLQVDNEKEVNKVKNTQNKIKNSTKKKYNLMQNLLEYIVQNTKGETLIHEVVNNQKSIYNLKSNRPSMPSSLANKQLSSQANQIKLNTHLMPKQVIFLGQRLPAQSLANLQNEREISSKIKSLLFLKQNQSFRSSSRFQFQDLKMNYVNRRLDVQEFKQTRHRFLIRRFVTKEYKSNNFELIAEQQNEGQLPDEYAFRDKKISPNF